MSRQKKINIVLLEKASFLPTKTTELMVLVSPSQLLQQVLSLSSLGVDC